MAGLAPSERYLDGSYLDANPDWHAEDTPWKFAQIVAILKRLKLTPQTIAEVGCGGGGVVDLVQAHFAGSQAVGYEFSPQAYALCASRTRPGLSYVNASAFDAGRHYDLAMAIDVIEHVEDCFAFARGMGEISDYQLFHIPLDLNVVSLLREWPILEARSSVGHIHYFTRKTAMALLTDCGLEVVDWHYTPWAFDCGGGTWKRSLVNLPRRIAYAFSADLASRILGGWALMIVTRKADA